MTPALSAPETPAPAAQVPTLIASPTTEPEATATAEPEPATESDSKPEVAIAVGRNDSGPRPPAVKLQESVGLTSGDEASPVETVGAALGEAAGDRAGASAGDRAGQAASHPATTKGEPGAATPLIAGIATTSAILAGVGGVQLAKTLRTRRLRIRRPQPAWPHT